MARKVSYLAKDFKVKVLITGRSGVGKSTTIRELQKRGYFVYDTDDMPAVSRLEIKATGEPADWPKGYVNWDYYAWRWQKGPLENLLNTNTDVIIGAIMTNQQDFYYLFDLIIVLTIDAVTLRNRLTNRTEHTYGNDIQNIERSVTKHQQSQKKLQTIDTVSVDNGRPTAVVADDIVGLIHTHKAAIGSIKS